MKWPAPIRKLLPGAKPRTRFAGHLDRLEPRVVAGWAADLDDFGTPLLVILVADGAPVAVVWADGPRPDLKLAGFGAGRHAYEFATPDLAKRGVGRIETYAVHQARAASLGLIDAEGRVVHDIAPARFDRMRADAGSGLFRLGGMEVPRKPSGERQLYLRAESDAEVFLDVYDLLAFLEQRRRVTGIQRVVSGLIRTSLTDPSRYPAFAFSTPTEEGEIVALPHEALAALVEKALTGEAELEELRADVAAIRADGRRVSFRPGDRYVVTGAYWLNPDYGMTLLDLRALGVSIGVFVYDLIPFSAPQFVTASNRAGVVERGVEVLSLCDFFLAISVFVERQLLAFLESETGRRPPTRAVLLPHELPGGAEDNLPVDPVHPRPYVLCVGTLEGRKNHLLLFEVWAALIRRHGLEAVPDLVLVGNWGWAVADFQEKCQATDFLGGKIVVRQNISDGELLSLYRNCIVTAFPSFLEGWGLPVGEALAVGKLCIASETSSIPEVGGAFADYLDPHDHLGAVAIFERAIFDETYRGRRERDIASGFRIRTWDETTAAFHLAVDDLAREAPPQRLPLLRAGIDYGFEGLMEDVLVSWERKLAKLALAAGWHLLERWGAWSAAPAADLRFFTEEAQGDDLIVTLSLVSPPGVEAVRLRLEAGAEPRELRLAGRGKVEVTARAGEGGRVELTLRSDPADHHAEGLRELFVGLAGLEVRRKGDAP